MDSTIWARVHGASTHLPIGLAFASWFFDTAGLVLARRPQAGQLHHAGYWTMLLAGASVFPAVASGLVLARGEVLGHDLLRLHHLFVWPAFTLLVGLCVWRATMREKAARVTLLGYLAVAFAAVCLLGGAGYWGGEMLLRN